MGNNPNQTRTTEVDTQPFIELISHTKGELAPHFLLPQDEFLTRTMDRFSGVQGRHSVRAAEALYAAEVTELSGTPASPDEDNISALAYWESWLTANAEPAEMAIVRPEKYAEYVTKMAARDVFAQHSARLHQLISGLENHQLDPKTAQEARSHIRREYQQYGFDSLKDVSRLANAFLRLRQSEDYQTIVRPAAKQRMLADYDPAMVERFNLSVSDDEVDAGYFAFMYLNQLCPPYALNEEGEFAWDVAMHRLGLPVSSAHQMDLERGRIPDVDMITGHFMHWNKTFIRTAEQQDQFLGVPAYVGS